ncbi:MAG: Na+/H+ antiporter NhaC family protein, partial [Bradymonadaceae bacterium]
MTAPDGTDGNDGDRHPMTGTITWPRLLGFVLAAAALLTVLPSTQADPATTRSLTAQFALRDHRDSLRDSLEELGATAEAPIEARLESDGSARAERLRGQLDGLEGLNLTSSAETRLIIGFEPAANRPLAIRVALERPDGTRRPLLETRRRAGRWTSILPPLLAILVALLFRQLILGLASAVWLGAAMQVGFAPLQATWRAASDYLWGSVADSFNLAIIGFTFALVGMVHVVIRMGGVAGIIETFSWLARSTRSTQLSVSLMGIAVFFDDYANTVVVGSSMRPLTDRKNISREKLAYLVDSTAAPIAGLAVVSTWIGYEVGLFGELSNQLALGMSGYEIFFTILPLRFYCILSLVLVVAIAVSGRDFGPMLRAERRARTTGEVHRPDSTPMSHSGRDGIEPKEDIPYRWFNAAAPMAAVIACTLLGMFWSGWRPAGGGGGIPGVWAVIGARASLGDFAASWAAAAPDLFDWTVWRQALSRAGNARVLFWSSVAGSLLAAGLAIGQDLLEPRETLHAWFRAIPMMGIAVIILVLAWSIQGVCSDLGTGIYLVGAVQDIVWPRTLPLLTFGLAAIVAFSTGTSWGTMGILLPAMIPLAFHVTRPVATSNLLLMMCFGAVLDGAIFGDHCSPLSDTTVMSSIGAGVDHLDHVRTQLPYALTSMTASALFGYLGVALGLPVWLALVLGGTSLVVTVALLGWDPEQP